MEEVSKSKLLTIPELQDTMLNLKKKEVTQSKEKIYSISKNYKK